MKLLIGGSPCTHWSIAQTKNRETTAEGIGWELFKNYLIAREKYKPDYFLYGRYMDDGYIISHSLAELADIKRCLYALAADMGIAMSDKKNIITPFRHHSFTFLKMRVRLTEDGKVVMKLSRKSIHAIRRKMDIFRRWLDEGRMEPEDVFQSYQSWRAHAKRCNSYDTLRALDERFTRMFAAELAERRKPFPCTMKTTRTGSGWIYRRHGAVMEEEMCA